MARGRTPRREGPGCARGGLLALATALAVTAVARGAAANSAPKQFFVKERSNVVLSARNNPPIRAARVDLALDFRREGRGWA